MTKLDEIVTAEIRLMLQKLRAQSNYALTEKEFERIRQKTIEVIDLIEDGEIDTDSGVSQ